MSAKTRLAELLAAKRKAREQIAETNPNLSKTELAVAVEDSELAGALSSSSWNWHEDQLRAIQTAVSGKPVAITGPAGSGKTTVEVEIARQLSLSLPAINHNDGHKYITTGAPGMLFVSFTNKAVENTRSKLPSNLRHNAMTIHKLLEFKPVFTEEWDPVKMKNVTKREFLPSRNAMNPLPKDIKVICMDEATMTGIPLWNELMDAIAVDHEVQIILFGDIQQLPPVFGKSIFIHSMQAGIETVELTHVHRQALESPILALAHRILSGKVIPAPELPDWNITSEKGDRLIVHPWKKALGPEKALEALTTFLPNLIDQGSYEPMKDTILTPYNKSFGTIEMNKIVATKLAMDADAEVHEILGGISKKYFRIGDKVLWDKTEHIITDIRHNAKYIGPEPATPSRTLDYWGIEHDKTRTSAMASILMDDYDEDAMSAEHASAVDNFLDQIAGRLGDEEKATSRAISSQIQVTPIGWNEDEYGPAPVTTIESAGELSVLDLGYAITVHKSQGSEYERVLFITHKSQGNMLFRELLYTAVTRAKRELWVIGEPNLFVKGITTQKIPGQTLELKLANFIRYIEINQYKGAEMQEPTGLWRLAEDKGFQNAAKH